MKQEEKLSYILGFFIGDGNLGNGYIIRAVEENKEFIEEYSKIFFDIFQKMPKIYFDKFNNSYVAYVHSKRIWKHFVNILEVPPGTKSRIVAIPRIISDSSETVKKEFIAGIFDAEGSITNMKDSHHRHGYPRIQFKVCSRKLAEDVFTMLTSFGIGAKLYTYHDFSVIHINGRKECTLFHERVGFKHLIKNKKLRTLL